MFNKYTTEVKNIYHSLPDTIDVHEHKAPTDESVRLLNEMEEKARKNIIASIHVDNNILNGVALMYEHDWATASCKKMVAIKFCINGKEYKFEELVDTYGISPDKYGIYLKDIYLSKIVKYIFEHLKFKIIDHLTGSNIEESYIKNYMK